MNVKGGGGPGGKNEFAGEAVEAAEVAEVGGSAVDGAIGAEAITLAVCNGAGTDAGHSTAGSAAA